MSDTLKLLLVLGGLIFVSSRLSSSPSPTGLSGSLGEVAHPALIKALLARRARRAIRLRRPRSRIRTHSFHGETDVQAWGDMEVAESLPLGVDSGGEETPTKPDDKGRPSRVPPERRTLTPAAITNIYGAASPLPTFSATVQVQATGANLVVPQPFIPPRFKKEAL